MGEGDSDYKPNVISRLFEGPVGCWRRVSGGLPILLVPVIGFVALIWAWLLLETLAEVWTLTSGEPQEGSGKEIADANRNRIQAIFFGVGIIGALLAAIVVPVRLWLQNRQTLTAEAQREISEQGHITDRLNKAIEMLGAEKVTQFRERIVSYEEETEDGSWALVEVFENADDEPFEQPVSARKVKYGKWEGTAQTEPNLEVRLGAIYALERIAQDSERDHITVMETLCAYIRNNAPASEAEDHGLGEFPEWIEDATEEQTKERDALIIERREKLIAWINALEPPRVDIQAALTVIGRRSDDRIQHERRQRRSEGENDPGFQLDLRNTNLRKADLRLARLDRALLTGARMEGANLTEARMDGADLSWVRMERANLYEARMEGADLRRARMEGASLYFARMTGANLHSAVLTSAGLGSDTLTGTSLRAADVRTDSVTQEMVNKAFGDASTKLPDGIKPPDNWDKTAPEWLVISAIDAKLHKWRKAGCPPGKPADPSG